MYPNLGRFAGGWQVVLNFGTRPKAREASNRSFINAESPHADRMFTDMVFRNQTTLLQ